MGRLCHGSPKASSRHPASLDRLLNPPWPDSRGLSAKPGRSGEGEGHEIRATGGIKGRRGMFDKLRPGTTHSGRVWLSFLVIGLIGAIGLAMLFMMRD